MVVAPNMDHGMVGKFEVNIGKYQSVTFCSILMDFITLLLSGAERRHRVLHNNIENFGSTPAWFIIMIVLILQCRDGYMLKGNNTTQCYFGNWTGLTPWCKEGGQLCLH